MKRKLLVNWKLQNPKKDKQNRTASKTNKIQAGDQEKRKERKTKEKGK